MNVYEPDFDKNDLKALDLAQQAEAAKLARQREQAAPEVLVVARERANITLFGNWDLPCGGECYV